MIYTAKDLNRIEKSNQNIGKLREQNRILNKLGELIDKPENETLEYKMAYLDALEDMRKIVVTKEEWERT